MVKVKVPFDTPVDDAADANAAGVMSDSDENASDDEIDDPDWEEVKHNDDDNDGDLVSLAKNLPKTKNGEYEIHLRRPKRGQKDGELSCIQIGVGEDDDDVPAKRRKIDFDELVRRRLNKEVIEKQLCKHKMSLLLFLARGVRLIKIINSDLIKALSLSLTDEWLMQQRQEPCSKQIEQNGKGKSNNEDTYKNKPVKKKETSKRNASKKSNKTQTEATCSTRVTRRSSRKSVAAEVKEGVVEILDEDTNNDIIELYSSHSPSKLSSSSKSEYKNDREYVQAFMTWFNETIRISDEKKEDHMECPFMVNLINCYSNREATSLIELVVMFLACLKAAKPSLSSRLVNIMRPVTMRANIIVKPNSKPVPQTKYSTDEKLDFWAEVYSADEKRWICVDLCNAQLDEPNVLNELNKPFHYVVSFDVDRNCVKSIEPNYCPDWYTPAFKRERCDPKWWNIVLQVMGPSNKNELDDADEDRNQEVLLTQDLPKSDAAFKNHPLYVLTKHLLKFEGIYPAEVAPVGFFKDQPVYPRDCVHTLMSREKWLRNARSVKLNETPYKIVKARPKRDRFSGDLVRDLPLELFGEWQTEDYVPPEAKDGIVPRNCYGNVDMYKPCMLPKGCTWLKLNGLIRVASKLGIDCAGAVVGFDCNSGNFGSHPVIDGYIVCDEFAETLRMAWEEEQENQRQKAIDKQMKRIFDNWRRLIKAAMIREKLRNKYKD